MTIYDLPLKKRDNILHMLLNKVFRTKLSTKKTQWFHNNHCAHTSLSPIFKPKDTFSEPSYNQ